VTVEDLDQQYARLVAEALGLTDPRDAVERVKNVVINELESVDRTVRIHATPYFNHTFVPDMVLSWPRDGSVSRDVFLRFTDDLSYMADGIRLLDSEFPMIVGLGDLASEKAGRAELEGVAGEKAGLVLDQGGLHTLASANVDSPVNTLMSSALAQGGLGVLDAGHAKTVTTVVANGFEGARKLQAGATGAAARVLEEVLNPRGVSRMAGFLQAVWVGSGGRIDLFPGRVVIGGSLSDQTLEFLLRFDEVADDEFWFRVGREVSLAQLGRLTMAEHSPNLQHLVQSNLDHLWCRGCVVSPEYLPLSDEGAGLAWYIDSGLLQLRGDGFAAGFAEQADQARQRGEAQRSDGLTLTELRQRARGAVLESLTLSDRANQMVFGSESHDDVVQSERLRDLADTFGAAARVQQAVAAIGAAQRVNLDFRFGLATGITKSKPLVAEMGSIAVPILADLGDAERAAVAEFLQAPEALQAEQPLEFEEDGPEM
jgi:hypothetical protein